MAASRSLHLDFLQRRSELAGFFAVAPGEWERAAAARRRSPAAVWLPEDLAELREFNAGNGAPAEVLRNVERLAEPGTLVVITGQQAGLALGPLYTIYKAMGAILHARTASERLGATVVPCFWIAAEDHDFEEVREVAWLGQSGEKESFRYEPVGEAGLNSVGDLILESSVEELAARLEATTPATEFRPAVLDWLRDGARAGMSWESMFARQLLALLGKHGLVALTPRLLGLRRRAIDLFQREMENPGMGSRLAMEAAGELEALGYEPALRRRAEDLNFYFQKDGGRLKLSWANGRVDFLKAGEVVHSESREECIAKGLASPVSISTAAAMRPLVQDSSLNTIAYIAGPGEIAYFAQLRGLYQTFGVSMPMIQPRPSVMLIDARSRRFLQKSGATLEQLKAMRPAPGAVAALAARGAGGEWQAYERARSEMESALFQMKAPMAGAGPAIAKAIEKLEAGQKAGFDTLRQRLEAELASRDGALKSLADKAGEWLWPDGQPQERVYSALAPLLVNYGFEAVERLMGRIDLAETGMQWLELDGS